MVQKINVKLGHILSVLVLLFGVFAAIPSEVQAASGTKVTINDAWTAAKNDSKSKVKYNAFAILSAKYNEDGAVSYELNSDYKDIVLAAIGKSADASDSSKATNDVLEFLKTNSDNKNGENETLRKFADTVTKKLSGKTADLQLTSGDNTVSADKLGYYLIVDNGDGSTEVHDYSAAILKEIGQSDIEFNVKASTPIVHKKVMAGVMPGAATATTSKTYQDGADYDIGDTVPFMVTGTISDQIKLYDDNTYTYKFEDTLPAALKLEESSIKVQVEKVSNDGYAEGINAAESKRVLLTKDADYTVNTTASGFNVNVTTLQKLVKEGKINPGDTVVVTYNTTLTDAAKTGKEANENKVDLVYSNNPYSNDTGKTSDRNAKVYTYKLTVNKVGGLDNHALKGAEFTLYKEAADGSYVEFSHSSPETSTDGTTFTFKGLDEAKYKLVETKVPTGYVKAEDTYFEVESTFENQRTNEVGLQRLTMKSVTGNNVLSNGVDANDDLTLTIKNLSHNEFKLPSTGGMGRYIFLALGAMIVVMAVAIPSIKKRKNLEN